MTTGPPTRSPGHLEGSATSPAPPARAPPATRTANGRSVPDAATRRTSPSRRTRNVAAGGPAPSGTVTSAA